MFLSDAQYARRPLSGTEVFLIDDPGRRGHLTGHSRERPDGKVYQVRGHGNTTSWIPEYDLEQVAAEPDDVFSLLRNKRFGRLNLNSAVEPNRRSSPANFGILARGGWYTNSVKTATRGPAAAPAVAAGDR